MRTSAHVWLASRTVCVSMMAMCVIARHPPYGFIVEYASECDVQESNGRTAVDAC